MWINNDSNAQKIVIIWVNMGPTGFDVELTAALMTREGCLAHVNKGTNV